MVLLTTGIHYWLVVWNIFIFPDNGTGIVIPLDQYFSEGLKPPTRLLSHVGKNAEGGSFQEDGYDGYENSTPTGVERTARCNKHRGAEEFRRIGLPQKTTQENI